jgi:predicted TIM-barrel enzyme/DNA-binding NtrC family response regulator
MAERIARTEDGAGVVDALRRSLRRPNTTLVGAAIGTGMAAQAATRGGADLLLALNAGRIRSMGAPSILSLLALRESNRFVMDFARSEILPNTTAPVFFGASAFDPRQSLEDIVQSVAAAHFHGVVNFPTAVFLDGSFRRAIEAAGVGFAREVELLTLSREAGLATLAYVHDAAEAEAMARAGVDIINLNLGWNVGGAKGVKTTLTVDQAAELSRTIFARIRHIHPDCLCLVEGGPIVSPEEMYLVCRSSKADGYVGGSTIDRVPSESSIEGVTSAFKAVRVLKRKIDELERKLERVQRRFSIVGRSDAMVHAKQSIDRLARSPAPLLIVGEKGTGKRLFAHALHEAARKRRSFFVEPASIDPDGAQLFGTAAADGRKRLVGHLEAHPGATILVAGVERFTLAAQARLLELFETGSYANIGDERRLDFTGRLIFTLAADARQVQPATPEAPLLNHLYPTHVALPALRDRLEDLTALSEHFLDKLVGEDGSPLEIDHSAYRILLAHAWPGNVRELRVVIEAAFTRCDGSVILGRDLPPLETETSAERPTLDEREWILDALRRHRFRKGETARYLRISRKTLYNKMRQYDLPIQQRHA